MFYCVTFWLIDYYYTEYYESAMQSRKNFDITWRQKELKLTDYSALWYGI